MVDISVVIVTYNVRDLLQNCLRSVYSCAASCKKSIEVFVVDNGNDGTDSMVSVDFPDVTYIPNPANDGYSRANNIALKRCTGKYILILNPDTVLEDRTFSVMWDFMESNPTSGIATVFVSLPDMKLDGACHRGFPTPWNAFCRFTHLSKRFPVSKIFNGYNLGYLDVSKVHQIDCIAGAFMFVRHSAIKGKKGVGYFDERFWAFGEDIDWCYRFKKKGWRIWFIPEIKVMHYKGASGGTQLSSAKITKADENTKKRWINAFYDAMPIFYKKHYAKKYPFFMKWLVLFGVEIKRRIALKKLLSE